MNSFIFYFLFFVFGYLGFFLGKVTKSEHKEINRFVLFISKVFVFLFYGVLFFLFYDSFWVVIVLSLFFVFLSRIFFDVKFRYHNVFLYCFGFVLLMRFFNDFLYFVLLVVFAIIFENSFKKFDLRREVLSLVFVLFVWFVFLFV